MKLYNIQPKTFFTAKNIIYLPSCHSTNESAVKIIQESEINEGTLVVTDDQTKGKGQRGNAWFSEKGKNLTFTLILRPHFLPVTEQFKLNIAVSLAIYKTFYSYLGDKLKIKWPNDILYKNSKMAGVLIESMLVGGKMDYTLVGLGINVNQSSFDIPQACSLSTLTEGKKYDLNEILERFSEHLETEYVSLQKGFDAFQKKEYLNALFQIEEWKYYEAEDLKFKGKIKGLNEFGQLLMETESGMRTFGNKDFRYLYG